MRTLIGWMMAGVAAVILAGCATSGGSNLPCESCKFGVADKKASPPKIYCVVDGKQVDCMSNPGACPGCKK